MNAPRHTQVLALAVMGVALLFAIRSHVGSSRDALAPAWAAVIERGEDHIDVTSFATQCIEHPESLVLIDVRPTSEYDAFHLPGAYRMDLPTLLGEDGERLLESAAERLVVLYSNGMTHPAQAWVELARRGHANVRVLEDGLTGFLERELTPPSLRGATTRARAEAERSRYDALLAWVRNRNATGRFASDPPSLEMPTIVSVAWLERHRDGVVILDARTEKGAYEAGHVPGAAHVPIAAVRGTVKGVDEELLEAPELAAVFGKLGIDVDQPVVVYGGDKFADATHLLWALYTLGHRRMGLLEGGYSAWRAADLAASTEPYAAEPRVYVPRSPIDACRVERDAVAGAMRTGTASILDVRPEDEYRGEHVREARPGHIPGSLHRFQAEDRVVDATGDYWKARPTLDDAYHALGLTQDAPVIVTCRTGHQATQTWFTLKWLLGYHDVRVYDGSWKDWSRVPELPAEAD
ncbi:MAG: hypothetical protein H6834_18285 [Planctomycetes bacterium]|nr:hypothetical protein [Planctomycetota bacterium]MCB9892240.1 hypothetical protein [Planctomycetota bacterium]